MSEVELEVVDEEFQEPDEGVGEHIIEYSKDRITVIFELAGQEYTATKPKKSEEWFIDLQAAMSSDNTGLLLMTINDFFAKIVGTETYAKIQKRRRDDEDELTWSMMSEIMKEIFEVWTSEADKPVRPTGRRSGSSRGKRRTTPR